MFSSVNKQIIHLSVPNIISNITVPLLGMVDLAIMGHLDSDQYLGAISLGSMIFNFIYISFNFLRMGTSGFSSQAYGRDDKPEIINILARSILIATLSGLLLMLLQIPINNLAFYLIDGSQEVERLASEYFFIRIYAAPATIGLFAITGWFIGIQDAKTPMFIAIFINIINVLLDLFFVYQLNMKSDGVALGTLISQYSGLLLASFLVVKKHHYIFKYFSRSLAMNLKAFKQFMNVNLDIFIRTVLLISVFSFFTAESAEISNNILSINTLLMQYLMIFSFVMDGFAYAAEALTGKYKGMEDNNMLRKTIKYVFAWGALFGLIFSLVYLLFGDIVLIIFTDNKELIKCAKPYLIWVAIVPLLSFASYLWDGIYIGLTASKAMRNTMLLSVFTVFIPVYFILKWAGFGNNALWIAMLLFLLARGVFQTIYVRIFTLF